MEEIFNESDNSKIENALKKVSRPYRGVYHAILLDGTELDIPFHLCSHAVALQAQRGEKYVDTEDDNIDVDRNIRLWIRKVNAGLEDGWRIVNDLMNAPNPPKGDIANKEIPFSQITTEDYAMLETILFPGSELTKKKLRERAAAAFSQK